MTGKKFSQAAIHKFVERLCTVKNNPFKEDKACGRFFGIFAAIAAIMAGVAGGVFPFIMSNL